MSDYTVISDITNTLLVLLRTHTGGLVAADHITSGSPADLVEDTSPRLSLYLYQIKENHSLKNQVGRSGAGGEVSHPPLAVDLLYLLTSYAPARDTEHQLIGRAMQIFYDYAIIRGSLLQGSLAGSFEEVTIQFHHLSIDDLNKLWSLFGNKPYRLSVTYQVSTALIDSTRKRIPDRVIQSEVQFST